MSAWLILGLVLGFMVILGSIVAIFYRQSSISFRRVKVGDTYKVGPHEHHVPNLKLCNRFFHVKDNVRAQMLSLMGDVTRLFQEHNIDYWLTCGTLLGQVRHGGFLPWDDDIDLGSPITFKTQLEQALDQQSELVLRRLPRIWKISRRGLRFPFVDILWAAPKDDKLCHCLPLDDQGQCTFVVHQEYPNEAFPTDWIYPLADVPFENLTVKAPRLRQQCIEHMFSAHAFTEAKESRWSVRNLPHICNHSIGAWLKLER